MCSLPDFQIDVKGVMQMRFLDLKKEVYFFYKVEWN